MSFSTRFGVYKLLAHLHAAACVDPQCHVLEPAMGNLDPCVLRPHDSRRPVCLACSAALPSCLPPAAIRQKISALCKGHVETGNGNLELATLGL